MSAALSAVCKTSPAADNAALIRPTVLGSIGLHRTGTQLDFQSLRKPFSSWVQEQTIAEEDFAFLAGLVAAFICEYLIAESEAQRSVEESQIILRLPITAGIAREFNPYQTAVGLLRNRKSLDDFLASVSG